MEIIELIIKSQFTIKNPAGDFQKEFGNYSMLKYLGSPLRMRGGGIPLAQIYYTFRYLPPLSSLFWVLFRFMTFRCFTILKNLHNDKTQLIIV